MRNFVGPTNPELWQLVRSPTIDAIRKMRNYTEAEHENTAPRETRAFIAKYGFKALFANPWTASSGILYDARDLEGLVELEMAIKKYPRIISRLGLTDEPTEGPYSESEFRRYLTAMIPLVLADRYIARGHEHINDSALTRLYVPQENFMLSEELRGDILVPIVGSKFKRERRFREFSIIKSTPEIRSIFASAQDISPMDRRALSNFDSAMIIRNTLIDASGCGYYFGAGPKENGYDLVERFFDGLNISAPLSSWFAQLAVRPRGWIGYFERPHGGIFCFLFRNHVSRPVNRINRSHELSDAEVSLGHRYGMALKTCHPSIRVAAHRFMLAFDRSRDNDDTIVDLCIGLEAILGAGFGETVHRISLRAAAMLARAGWQDSREIYKAIRDIYSYRSKVVHGVRGPYKESELHLEGTMIHAVRYGTAALSALIELALNTEGFSPDKVDEIFVFSALND